MNNQIKQKRECDVIVNEILIRCGDTFNRELYLCDSCKELHAQLNNNGGK